MGTLRQDLQYAFRTLLRAPGFTAIAVLTLALGIGATTSIFSLVNAVLLRPLPYRDAEQIVALNEIDLRVGDVSVAYPDFLDWQQMNHVFSEMAAIHNTGANLSGAQMQTPERVVGYGVSPNFLSMIGVRPILGRDLLPGEEKKGTAPVLLISYAMWQTHLAGDPNAIGKAVTLDGQNFVVVGILPRGFTYFGQTDFISAMGVYVNDDMMERGNHGDMAVIARLAPGVTFGQANAEMNGIQGRLAAEYGGAHDNIKSAVAMQSLRDAFVSNSRPELIVLFAAVGFVLLIACVNVANLYLVRASARGKEIALRLALGASRGRILRQILTECSVIAAFGGGFGILAGFWGINGLTRIMPDGMVQNTAVGMDRAVLLFAAGIIVLVTFAFGLAPALAASKPDVHDALKEGGKGSTSGAHNRLRAAFAVAEIALAMVLLIGAGLMIKSLARLLRVDGGFRTDNVLTMELELDGTRYSNTPAVLNFWQQSLDRVRAIPGVKIAAIGTALPLTGDHSRTDISFADMATPERGQYPHPDVHVISGGYIEAMGIPLLKGRSIADTDTETSPLVGLINEKLAQRYFKDQDPIGKQFMWGRVTPGKAPKWMTVVGIVADTKLYGLDNPSRFEVYVPYRQNEQQDMHVVVRSSVDPGSLTSSVREALASVDKNQPAFGIATMQKMESDAVSDRRSTLLLLSVFSGFALLLAGMGIYGVIAFSTARRTHEIGIRVALGAQRGDILRMILGECARLAFLGVGIGVVAALGLTRLMSTMLYGVGASDPLTFVAVAGILILVAFAACWLPARRAMRVDPMIALRYE